MNFILYYLLEYTEKFAKKFLHKDKCKIFEVKRVRYDFKLKKWVDGEYLLPNYKNDFVILTPSDILVSKDAFINKNDLVNNFDNICMEMEESIKKEKYNRYIITELENLESKERKEKVFTFIKKNPEFIDEYIVYKEKRKSEAKSVSMNDIRKIEKFFNIKVKDTIYKLEKESQFFEINVNNVNKLNLRINILKDYAENNPEIFYFNNKPISNEYDLMRFFELIWFTNKNVDDFKYKMQSNIDVKLASNYKLEQYLKNEDNIVNKKIIILTYDSNEYDNLCSKLQKVKLKNNNNIIIFQLYD